MEIEELGAHLRHRRVASGRTIASVAAEAGLSVPYIANLENGRGNPTLAAVNRLAEVLGVRLSLNEPPEPPALPDSLVQFARTARFADESARLARTSRFADESDHLARTSGETETLVRQRLLHAMAAMSTLTGRPLTELDWHRILDTVVLVTRE
ncbi:helix-turn-helix domain-containing protein [Actinoplanes sp. LDG1-06]|uniref:Helix-turn-helix domain-containing protein n=1 Tax=Paractinoplanes ovalisporus TaxID=2810368 RepID=A0ABS2A369_9ACTN|nr:helix-turn-helix domain-containing protein [Actinoplanes ovalisporus]MBM2614292.1 helix-turn-helix domain-containing protein [Actinoplanes ovalisporus]